MQKFRMKSFPALSIACALLAVFFLTVSEGKVLLHHVPANVTYHVWYHPEPAAENALVRQIQIESLEGNTVFSIMYAASLQDDIYDFEYTQHPAGGKVITSIGGYRQDEDEDIAWVLYKLQTDADPINPPPDIEISDFGVDGQTVQDGEQYLFWRRVYVKI